MQLIEQKKDDTSIIEVSPREWRLLINAIAAIAGEYSALDQAVLSASRECPMTDDPAIRHRANCTVCACSA